MGFIPWTATRAPPWTFYEAYSTLFGTFVSLQKILTSKAKRKKSLLIVFVVEKKNVLCVIKIYHIT